MKSVLFSAILIALTGCGVSDGTDIQYTSRSEEKVNELSCKIQWITTKEDIECAACAGIDLENTRFLISCGSLDVRECGIVPIEGKEVLSCKEVLFGTPMTTDVMLSVVKGGDTLNVELWLCVPLKDGGLVCLDTPLTADISFNIEIDSDYDGDYDVD